MKDSIVQEVRNAKAAVAEDFEFDLAKFFAWARTHTEAEQKAKHRLPTGQNRPADNRMTTRKSRSRSGV